MFTSTGQFNYDHEKRRAFVLVDDGIPRFYRALIPKSQKWLKPMYASHITVVRTGIETVSDDLWGYADGRVVEFSYDPYICIGNKYIWLNVYSEELEDIRVSLGLPKQRPHPNGETSCFHITIANMKFQN